MERASQAFAANRIYDCEQQLTTLLGRCPGYVPAKKLLDQVYAEISRDATSTSFAEELSWSNFTREELVDYGEAASQVLYGWEEEAHWDRVVRPPSPRHYGPSATDYGMPARPPRPR